MHYAALYSNVPSCRTKAFNAESVMRPPTYHTRMRDCIARPKHHLLYITVPQTISDSMYLLTGMLLLIRAELTDLLVVLSLSSKGYAIN